MIQTPKFFWPTFYAGLLLAALTVSAIYLKKELKVIRRNVSSYEHFLKAMNTNPEGVKTSTPLELINVPKGEETGLVVGTKTIQIRGDVIPYNASLIQRNPEGYHLVFRYDEIDENSPAGFYTYLGLVDLDQNFDQTEKEFTRLQVQNNFAEDPRVLQTKDNCYLFYNTIGSPRNTGQRLMCMAELDPNQCQVKKISPFNPCLQSVEKNWVPFEYADETNTANVYFEYTVSPLKILKVENNSEKTLTHLSSPYNTKRNYWPRIWGPLRGGTPALLVDGQYLAFFHSSFKDKQKVLWYCLGAYTFEATPPFRITGISHYPIMFKGIYNTPPLNTADPLKRVIFPCGFVVEKRAEGDWIHLSCGENDASVKIVTLNKDKLLQGLKKIKPEKKF